jgi:hypothetical protein
LFNTRNIAWFAVGMGIAFGVIHAWFYGPRGTLYASRFPTRIRHTGLSTIYQVFGIYASGLTPLILTSLIAANHGVPLVCLRLSGCDCGAQRGRDGPAQRTMTPDVARAGAAMRAHGVAGQALGIGPSDVLWSSCDCSDR